jgi:enamine deaminase RidA (YjgF/YER057c/UK114 family)
MSVKRINAGPRMSSAVVHGDTVYLAGLTADDAKADVKGQTKQILDKIDKFLKEAGTDKSKILSANIWPIRRSRSRSWCRRRSNTPQAGHPERSACPERSRRGDL